VARGAREHGQTAVDADAGGAKDGVVCSIGSDNDRFEKIEMRLTDGRSIPLTPVGDAELFGALDELSRFTGIHRVGGSV